MLHGAVARRHRPVWIFMDRPFCDDQQPITENMTMATTTIGELDLESAAKEAVGNWQEFDCFSWDRSEKSKTPTNSVSYTRISGTAAYSINPTPKRSTK